MPLFTTEQIYIANRDGYDLKPLTSREGLIYFYFSWAPDNHALVALACKENEWSAREKEFKQPAGRPRLLELDGKERLLDDQLTEALPVWSPDAAQSCRKKSRLSGMNSENREVLTRRSSRGASEKSGLTVTVPVRACASL